MSSIHMPGTQRSAYASLSRAGGDTLAVIRGARSASALEWLFGLVTHVPDVVQSRSLRPADMAWRRHGATAPDSARRADDPSSCPGT